jgi:hypothetical protein
MEARETEIGEGLCLRDPAATETHRPDLSSERAPNSEKPLGV